MSCNLHAFSSLAAKRRYTLKSPALAFLKLNMYALGSSDHNQLHFNINIKSDKTKVKQCRRDFRKGNYREIRKNLAHIDWDEKMKNKTATECWDILINPLAPCT